MHFETEKARNRFIAEQLYTITSNLSRHFETPQWAEGGIRKLVGYLNQEFGIYAPVKTLDMEHLKSLVLSLETYIYWLGSPEYNYAVSDAVMNLKGLVTEYTNELDAFEEYLSKMTALINQSEYESQRSRFMRLCLDAVTRVQVDFDS